MTWFFWWKAEQAIRKLQGWTVKHRVAARKRYHIRQGKKAQ
jgi:hypothetical protein